VERDKLSVQLPPHDRLTACEFRNGSLHVLFADGRGRVIKADSIIFLSGARIRNEVVAPAIPPALGRAYAGIDPQAFVRSEPGPSGQPGGEAQGADEFSFVVKLRVLGVAELWFLVADSFNFRKTLGADAGYSTEANLRTLVRRLAAFSPNATQDKFFAAVLGNAPLPPPVGSLVEFFKTA